MTTKQRDTTPLLDNLMTRQEFAAVMKVTPRSTDRWALQRKGPPRFQIGVQVFYDRVDAEAYVQELKQAASERWATS